MQTSNIKKIAELKHNKFIIIRFDSSYYLNLICEFQIKYKILLLLLLECKLSHMFSRKNPKE